MEQFDFFVDSSPKIAEVKIAGAWTSLLILGEGSGGTFYQAFDVSEAGMGVSQTADGLSAVSAMLSQFDTPDESISFKWAFPNYSSFDPTYSATFTVTDGTSGGKVKLFGDLEVDRELRREDRRLHLVGPGGRSARHQPRDQRRDRRLRLLPGPRGLDPGPRRRAQGRQCGLPARRQYRQADRQLRRHDLRDDLARQRDRHRMRERRRRLEQPQERAADGPDRGRQHRQLRRQPRLHG